MCFVPCEYWMKGWVKVNGSPYFGFMQNLESQTRTFEALMEICHEKDDVITKLQEAIDQNSEAATRDVSKLLTWTNDFILTLMVIWGCFVICESQNIYMLICIPFHCFCPQTALVDSIKEEILSLKRNCNCMSRDGSSAEEGRNRHADVLENLDHQPALKKGSHKRWKELHLVSGLMLLIYF